MTSDVKVAIIGAGLGGIGMGIRLRDSGEESFVLLEKAGGVGGTWRDNIYPGAACDVQSHLYWFPSTRSRTGVAFTRRSAKFWPISNAWCGATPCCRIFDLMPS